MVPLGQQGACSRTDKLKHQTVPNHASTAGHPLHSPTRKNFLIATELQMRNVRVSSGDLKKNYTHDLLVKTDPRTAGVTSSNLVFRFRRRYK